MSRLSAIVDRVRAVYPDASVRWYVGQEHVPRHDGWDRIVVYAARGTIVPPDQGSHTKTDQTVRVRRIETVWGVWAADYDQAESRLHALIVAIDQAIGETDLAVEGLSEAWPGRSVADGGSLAVLTCTLAIPVLTSDRAVVASGAAPGAGIPTVPASDATISYNSRIPVTID